MIFLRTVSLLLLALSTVALPAASAAAPAPALRLHWLGLSQISADTNAAQLLKIWRLPETTALANETLDKLSAWLAGGPTNPARAQLRPLLDDLIASEFYLELYAPADSANSKLKTQNSKLILLALRLPPARAALWHTNLAAVHDVSLKLTQSGPWTILAVGPQARDRLPQFTATLSPAAKLKTQNPKSKIGEAICEATLAPGPLASLFNASAATNSKPKTQNPKPSASRLLAAFNLQPSTFNRLALTLTATHGEVLTHATATLAAPWTNALPAWDIPTNLLHDSLSSLTAVRGLGDWLAGLPAWRQTRLAPAPDQAFAWADSGIPFQTYVAFPLPDASNQLTHLSARLLAQGNPWLTHHAQGNFEWNAQLPGLVWNGALIINPFLTTATVHGQPWLLAGLYPRNPLDASPAPPAILRPLHDDPNLVYYQAEQTGARADAGFFILQLFRVVFQKPQLPPAAPATLWLKHIEPDLGPGTTVITRTGPQTLTLSRRSTLGLSALELHLLADWLESPSFPHGLHTFTAKPGQP